MVGEYSSHEASTTRLYNIDFQIIQPCKTNVNFTLLLLVIIGIGTDLVEVSRIEKLVLESHGFKERVFSPSEISYCESGKNRFERFAARFAAKEAFAKALGIGIFGVIPMYALEVRHGDNHKPYLFISNLFFEKVPQLNCSRIHLSISHTEHYATATVVIESGD